MSPSILSLIAKRRALSSSFSTFLIVTSVIKGSQVYSNCKGTTAPPVNLSIGVTDLGFSFSTFPVPSK